MIDISLESFTWSTNSYAVNHVLALPMHHKYESRQLVQSIFETERETRRETLGIENLFSFDDNRNFPRFKMLYILLDLLLLLELLFAS